jgi:hypothetical protein
MGLFLFREMWTSPSPRARAPLEVNDYGWKCASGFIYQNHIEPFLGGLNVRYIAEITPVADELSRPMERQRSGRGQRGLGGNGTGTVCGRVMLAES